MWCASFRCMICSWRWWIRRSTRRCCFFFFQAEDGIRDYKVTGVQTCALPIYFGIARLAEAEGAGQAMTQAGLVLGTPEYISPEQATGQRIDARADVYAFGILA